MPSRTFTRRLVDQMIWANAIGDTIFSQNMTSQNIDLHTCLRQEHLWAIS